jgi:hypothetical protein
MHSVNLQFLLNILDILDIKVWSLKKNLSMRDSILGHIAFFSFVKKILCVGANDYVRYIPFYFCKFLSIIFS